MFLGVRTVIYPAPDLAASTAWFTRILGFGPYFDEPFYVGFNVGGYELGLDPNADPASGAQSYWGVADLDVAVAALVEAGASTAADIQEPGDDIRIVGLREPGGSFLGLIQNPHFQATAVADGQPGPGR